MKRACGLLGIISLFALSCGIPEAVALDTARGGTLAQPQDQTVIPDKFLRRWDPVTFFLDGERGPAKGGPEHHPEKYVSMTPSHPGVFTWLNAGPCNSALPNPGLRCHAFLFVSRTRPTIWSP